MANKQVELPGWLQYRRSEDVVRAEVQFQNALQEVERKLSTVNHIQPKTLAEEYLLPAIAHQAQFFALQTGDVLRYVAQIGIYLGSQIEGAAQVEEDAEVMVGIPPEDAEALLGSLDELALFIERAAAKKASKDEAKKMRALVDQMRGAIQELVLEEGEEGDEDDEYFDLDEDEEGTDDADGDSSDVGDDVADSAENEHVDVDGAVGEQSTEEVEL